MGKAKSLPIHPGEILRKEFIEPMEISQYRLAKHSEEQIKRQVRVA